MSLNGKEDVDDRRVFDERPAPPQVRLMLAAHFGHALLSGPGMAAPSNNDDALVSRAYALADKFLAKAGL